MESATTTRTAVPAGLDASTLAEAFQLTAAAYPDRPAIRTKGDEFTCTWGEYAQKAESVARGLAALGLGAGDTIGIMLTNRPEFHFVDSAALHLGATPFSIYNTYTAEQIEYLVGDAANKILVTENAFLPIIKQVKGIETIVVVDGDGSGGTLTLEQVESRGSDDFDFEGAWKAVKPDDVLTLIYTSGTTGPPKGVQLTHDNLMLSLIHI